MRLASGYILHSIIMLWHSLFLPHKDIGLALSGLSYRDIKYDEAFMRNYKLSLCSYNEKYLEEDWDIWKIFFV